MNKSVSVLAMLAALATATPALAQHGERDAAYSNGFPYRPFHVQIEAARPSPRARYGRTSTTA